MNIPRPGYWIGVVSREHVRRGVAGGFAQIGHGKAAPLRRMAIGDWLIYYSPVETLAEGVPCRRFTAIGQVRGASVYQVDMGGGFMPYRRDVDYGAIGASAAGRYSTSRRYGMKPPPMSTW
jgi:hypothetical protein